MSDGDYLEIGPNAVDITGRVFGRLTALGPVKKSKRGKLIWRCSCTCGTEKDVEGVHLRNGGIRSCGCLNREINSVLHTTHGREGTPEYRSWKGMRTRCRNPAYPSYPNYGGRGIDFCPEWESFEQFFADMGIRPAGTSLERIDNSGGYCPGNCCWATRRQQANNKRSNVFVTYRGSKMTIAQAARLFNLTYGKVHDRITRQGMSVEYALEKDTEMNDECPDLFGYLHKLYVETGDNPVDFVTFSRKFLSENMLQGIFHAESNYGLVLENGDRVLICPAEHGMPRVDVDNNVDTSGTMPVVKRR